MSGRIDISVLGYDARGSGVVRNALRIAQAAQEAGLRVELWMAHNNGKLGNSLPGTIPIRTYGTGPAGWGRTAALAFSVPSLARMIREERPRLLLSSGNHMHLATALAFQLAGRPRETILVMRASNATWRRTLEASSGKGELGWMGKLIDAVNRLQYRAADHVVAVCDELRKALQNDIGLPAEKLSTVANGVDAEGIRARAAEPLDHPWLQASDAPLIVAVGRLSRQKNFESLLQAFARLRRQRPARLAIVGENIGGGETRLRALAASLGVADDVLITGFDANPFRWMKRASIVAVTSRYEGSSNVVLEALAIGTPVLAFRCPTGIAEVLAPVAPANVIAQGDIAAFADRLAALLAQGPATPAHPAAVPTLTSSMQGYVDLFRRLLANRPKVDAPPLSG